ncbi:MAG: sulfotransferase [Xanthomonadaceae bacterium]|nr:sulfotransferase [Xanthomonadaceae bacterium]
MSRSPEQRWQRAIGYLEQGQYAAAHAQLEALQAALPGDVRTHLLASEIAWREDRVRDGSAHARDAAEAGTMDPGVLCAVVEALLRVGEVALARECLARPPLADSDEPRWLLKLADYRQRLDENAEALRLIESAIARGATGAEVRFHHGVQLYFNGCLGEAEAELEASLRADPPSGRAALALSRLRRQSPEDNHLDLLAEGLGQVPHGAMDKPALLFAQYKVFEDLGRNEDAWRALELGNALMHARNPREAAVQRAFLARLIEACGEDAVKPRSEPDDGPQPIFIVGMPRSGTTVLERMLGNHSQVRSAGELVDFELQVRRAADTRRIHAETFTGRIADLDLDEVGRCYLAQTRWRARGRRFFIDKQPPNWMLAGLIHAALPGARILHLVRDPMDVCFSNWRAFFGDTYGYSYDIADLAAHHDSYRRTMAHWHKVMPGAVLDVPYERLVREPDTMMRRVFAFCGLDWEPGCTDMRGNAEPVATLSAAQVREPLHSRAFGEWQRYAVHLAPLREALSRNQVSEAIGS